ncbi:Glutathione-binding protein GsiB precursor [Thalassovita gelatinovora]|uniref:Glutathione-binding protein GsiB n=1 Tax=Thalassovita gelatinovora TaxID=53501 RepID=A0A0P1FJZ8_THAGE|nr:ABC transporter substrate-binding protein [Thalassovita gelatinovora]QIZ82312.1 hypothetical protein HFZ77_18430 [Thalassovita gelatinovora]CUH68359.1 Glutathione-binding protein GsiB precursor [Thalassovita gelatinovora]SER19374.1 peptide/nickel transport system substrate-binding protein [Thalassovita gelatinovora]
MLKHLLTSLALAGLVFSSPAQAETPQDGGTLKVGIASTNVTNGLDPHVLQGFYTEWVLGQVGEGLLNYDINLNLVPWLAKSWTISEDGLVYTFDLQEGVKFHNGREMTAEDVKFSIERILDPNTGSRRRVALEPVDHVEVIDNYTVALHLNAPFAPLLSNLAGVWAAIIPPESVNADGTITQPIGTGPFTYVEWVKNDHLTVSKFADYWQADAPHVDEIVFLPVSDDAARMTALRTGAVDIITSVPAQLLPSLLADTDRGFEIKAEQGNKWRIAIMNNAAAPFDNVLVRQAVDAALDREEIMLARTFGFGHVDNQTWDKNSFWRMDGPAPVRDLDRVKALLTEAGYPDGLPITIESRSTYLDDAQMVQAQLIEAGFDAKIEVSDWAALKERMKAGEYHMVISGAGWYADPDSRYGRFYVKSGPANYFAGGYENAEVEALIAQGRVESDAAARKAIYQKVFDIIQAEVPHSMLYFAPKTLAWRSDVKDFRTDREGNLANAEGGLAFVWLNR